MTATAWSNDWMGGCPVFYNTVTGRVSFSIHDVIDYRNLEFDGEGLTDFLDFGYCVFGHTPVRDVRFLPACHRLDVLEGSLVEVPLPDPACELHSFRRSENEVIELFRQKVAAWESQQTAPIVLPMSGGFDSRLLAAALKHPERALAFTYPICRPGFLSQEVATARSTARQLGLPWRSLRLAHYFESTEAWESLFGISTHLHGMYHMEFYRAIGAAHDSGLPVLSGIVGDLWAGSVSALVLRGPGDLRALGYTHGLDASLAPSFLRTESGARVAYWEGNHDRLQDPKVQVIEVIRTKMMLLRYLLLVPRELGFVPWSPFVSEDLALAMVALPEDRRRNRIWQRDWLERLRLPTRPPRWASPKNDLDATAFPRARRHLLNASLLSELFPRDYIDAINRMVVRGSRMSAWPSLLDVYGILPRVLRRLGRADPFARAIGPFLTLKALELLIARRNRARGGQAS